MNKTILSVLVLGIVIIAALIGYEVVTTYYPDFGSFYNLLYIDIILFFLGIGIFTSGLLLRKGIAQSNN